MANRYKNHQNLCNQVLNALQKRFPEGRFFTRHVGMFRFLRSNGIIKINKPGMSDIWGLYKGRHIEIEVKTGKARQTKDQKRWEKAVKEAECEYYLVRSVEDVNKIPR